LRTRLGSVVHTRLTYRMGKLEFGSAAELLENACIRAAARASV